MTLARLRLVLAALLFVGWLSWLGYAVSWRASVPIVSRGQLAGATHLVVVDVSADTQGLPAPMATVTQVLHGTGIAKGATIEVLNLPSAQPPIGGFAGSGQYLLPLVGEGKLFRVAGLPRSPGYDASMPTRPVIYPWSDDVRAQLKQLGWE